MSYNYLFKIIMVGNSGVGKSSFLTLFTEEKFTSEHNITIGVDFGAKYVNIGDKKIKLQIWDTAGQERFRAITRAYYRDAAACILLYDVSCRKSFNDLDKWVDDVKSMSNNINIILVGHKSDLVYERVVSYEEGKEYAEKHNMLFIEASSIKNENVEDVFINIAKNILRKIENENIDIYNNSNGIKVGIYKNSKFMDNKKNREIWCCLVQ